MKESLNIKPDNKLSGDLKSHRKSKTNGDKKIRRVLLFRAPAIDYSNFNIAAEKLSRWMVYQPLGLAYLASSLRVGLPNLEIKIYDLEYETVRKMFDTLQNTNVLEESVKEAVADFKPDLVGVSVVYSPAINNGLKIAKITKELNENIIVVFGGVHCTFDYETILKNKFVDAVMLNEAENTFVDYIKYLNEEASEDKIKGLAFLNRENKITKIPFELYPDFDKLPLPAWDLIDTSNYYKVAQVCGLKNVIDSSVPTGVIQTSRGCGANCVFCSVKKFSGLKIRDRSPENVLKEIDILYNQFGIKAIEFVDDDFTHDRKRSLAICKGLKERNYDLTWSLDNGVRLLTLDGELIDNLIKSGCRLISVGVESGNEEILRKIRKPLTIKALYEKMELLHRYPELYVKGNFIVGFPFESHKQMGDTFRVAKELKFDWTIFSIYSPLVGTDAFSYTIEETKTDIDISKINYEKTLIMPDGFSSKEEFYDKVYLENLRCNFIDNPNYKGRNINRALNDFLRIVNTLCSDHAVSLYCISDIYRQLNDIEKQKSFQERFNNVMRNSDKWRFYCESLNIPIEQLCKGECK